MVKACVKLNIKYLTLFAFSSENWRRPAEEVSFLMGLFIEALKYEVAKLHDNNVRLMLIGDRSQFSQELVEKITESEKLTANNTGLVLTIAANYGGRWDILQSINQMVAMNPNHAEAYSEEDLSEFLSMAYAPEPDLFIRTGGEVRVSNFLLWQLAYTELYFTDTLWPDFDEVALKQAIVAFQHRERRFGRTSEQVTSR
jgi:undecaprenyl diphosphate synthase